jgi:hypothetical protein
MIGSSETKAEVQSFFEHLAVALTTGDGKAVSELWEVPALVLSDDQTAAVGALSEVERFFGGAKEQYLARGVSDTRPDIRRIDQASDRMLLVDVRWPQLDDAGHEVGDEASTYVLRRDDDGKLKIRAVAIRGGKA